MEYVTYKDFSENPIPLGKYTVLWIGGMATTNKRELEILEFKEYGNYAQYNDIVQVIFKEKGKRKINGFFLKSSMAFLSGWNLGVSVDTDFNSFKGNACLNLVGEEEDLKEIIKEHNKNKFLNYGIITFSDSKNLHNEKMLYPEKADLSHAVVNRIMKNE
jgi:hypothetical protein